MPSGDRDEMHDLQDLCLDLFLPGMNVLDVGCGAGRELERLAERGCRPVGIDPCDSSLTAARHHQIPVHQACAEQIPLPPACMDGVICQVTLPYTDEARAVCEIERVLKAGGAAAISCHGSGYYLWRLVHDRSWKRRLYCLRTVLNTWVYRLSGRRLPGFWGDTLYQSPRWLARHYRAAGLELVVEKIAPWFLGRPVFIYHTLRKPVAVAGATATPIVPEHEELRLLNEVRALSAEVRSALGDANPADIGRLTNDEHTVSC